MDHSSQKPISPAIENPDMPRAEWPKTFDPLVGVDDDGRAHDQGRDDQRNGDAVAEPVDLLDQTLQPAVLELHLQRALLQLGQNLLDVLGQGHCETAEHAGEFDDIPATCLGLCFSRTSRSTNGRISSTALKAGSNCTPTPSM